MEIRHLWEFTVLADVRNYLEASELLFISQSTLSKHIKALEKELGVQLFDRSTRHVRLTDAGSILLAHARQVTALQYQWTTDIQRLSQGRDHSLTVGSLPIMAPYGITDALAEFRRLNPAYSVRVIEGGTTELTEALRHGECHVAFIRESGEEDDEFECIPFASDSLAAIVPVGHRTARRKTVQLEQLAREEFLLITAGSTVHQLSLDACRAAGFEPNVVYVGERAENIIDLVERGMGVGLLMRKAARRLSNTAGVAVIEVRPRVDTYVNILVPRHDKAVPAARQFVQAVTGRPLPAGPASSPTPASDRCPDHE